MKIRFVVLAALLVWTAPLQAAFDAFLKIEGVDGESTAVGFEKQIEVYSYSWGMSNPSSVGSGGGGGTGKVSMQDFHFMKRIDKGSPLLMLHGAMGTHIPSATFVFRKGGADRSTTYYEITLENVLVSSYSTGGTSTGDGPMESVSLNFTKITVKYFPQDAAGGTGEPIKFGWDLATGTKI